MKGLPVRTIILHSVFHSEPLMHELKMEFELTAPLSLADKHDTQHQF